MNTEFKIPNLSGAEQQAWRRQMLSAYADVRQLRASINADPVAAQLPRLEVLEVVNAARLQRTHGGTCKHFGTATGQTEFCDVCGVHRDVATFHCSQPVAGPTTNHYKCLGCRLHEKSASADCAMHPDDPLAGVVIGSYHWPKLVALQIILIRSLCGEVPILICDDATESPRAELLKWICKILRADLIVNSERKGHLWGDTLAFRNGLTWANERGLKTIAKLSQRFLVRRPRWLQEISRELLDSGRCIATQECRHKNIGFVVRTEAAVLNVAQWMRPDVLHHLSPEGGSIGGENTIGEALFKFWNGGVKPNLVRWNIMTRERHFQYKDDAYWHHQDDNVRCEREYRDLAAKYGLTLDDDFQCGWPAGSARAASGTSSFAQLASSPQSVASLSQAETPHERKQ
jgi:hypothetical protein